MPVAVFFRLVTLVVLTAAPYEGLVACTARPLSGIDMVSGESVTVPPGSKGTVVAFLSAKCPCSRSHEGALARLSREYPDFRFVGVNSNADENETAATFHFRQSGLPFPVLRDKGGRLADALGALKTPHVFVIGPAGQCHYQGGVDDSKDAERARQHYLRDALAALSRGNEPERKTARALGCTITR